MKTLAAWVVTFAVCFALQADAHAGEFSTREVGYNEIVEVRSEEPCLWDARDPLTLRLVQYEVVDHENEGDTDFVAIFQSGSKPATIVIDAWRNGETIPDKDRFVIVVAGGADPDDPDDPDPDDPLPDSRYGVGPATARGWEGTPTTKLQAIFRDAAIDIQASRSVPLAIRGIRDSVQAINGDGTYTAGWTVFTTLMEEKWADKTIRSVAQHAGAYEEIAEWLAK